jgi:hypothetical protein
MNSRVKILKAQKRLERVAIKEWAHHDLNLAGELIS